MSNVNVRSNIILLDIREVDFSDTSKEYARAEITTDAIRTKPIIFLFIVFIYLLHYRKIFPYNI